MYLYQTDPDNYDPCPVCNATGKVRCTSCGGSGCIRCQHDHGYTLCSRCSDSRSVFHPKRTPPPPPPPPPPPEERMSYGDALSNAESRRHELIQWLSKQDWFYSDYKQRMTDWLTHMDLQAPATETQLNEYADKMIEENQLVRGLKERLKSLAYACFIAETLKRIGS